MDVSFSDSFKKAFRKRTKNPVVEKEFWIRLEIFINDPFNPKLKNYKDNL